MTREDVKKAVTICTSQFDCNNCPYENANRICKMPLLLDVLALITEQEDEIKQLKNENKQAKIEVLEKLKARYLQSGLLDANGTPSYGVDDFVIEDNIDKLIEEVKAE